MALARLVDCIVRVYWSRPAPVRRGRAVLVVLVDYCGSAGRRGAAVSRAAAAPLVVRLVVVLVVLGSGSVESVSAWRSSSHA